MLVMLIVVMGIGDPESPRPLLAPMGLPMVAMVPMVVVFGTVGGRFVLFMHFSMCPLRTSLRLNFLPHS